MPFNDEEIWKLFRVRRTVLQMLRDRGYTVDNSDIEMNRNDFVNKFGADMKREQLFIHTNKGPNPTDQTDIRIFSRGTEGGCSSCKNLCEPNESRKCSHRNSGCSVENVHTAIVVVPSSLSAPARAAVVQVNSTYRMEVFEEAELLSNISEHKLVPPHRVLDDTEKKELLDKYRVKDTQLPRILVNDPVARYYGLRRGQVVKIIRDNRTSVGYATYRYAV